MDTVRKERTGAVDILLPGRVRDLTAHGLDAKACDNGDTRIGQLAEEEQTGVESFDHVHCPFSRLSQRCTPCLVKGCSWDLGRRHKFLGSKHSKAFFSMPSFVSLYPRLQPARDHLTKSEDR